MSPNDDLPIDPQSGNPYDSLFASRIDALGKGSGRSSPPPQAEGGRAWPGVLVAIVIIGLLRGCSALESPRTSRPPDFQMPRTNTNELIDQIRREQQAMDNLDNLPPGEDEDAQRRMQRILEALRRAERENGPVEPPAAPNPVKDRPLPPERAP